MCRDDVVYIESQKEAVITIGATNGTHRAPVTIGPSFFSSFGTFPGTQYIAGINLAVNGSNGTATRLAETAFICKALGDRLINVEIGNEPDLFKMWNRRAESWNISDYVTEWQTASQLVDAELTKSCPGVARKIGNTFFGPSFAGTDFGSSATTFGPFQAFENGLNAKRNIATLSGHKYYLPSYISFLYVNATNT
jgi:hypothetical protein